MIQQSGNLVSGLCMSQEKDRGKGAAAQLFDRKGCTFAVWRVEVPFYHTRAFQWL